MLLGLISWLVALPLQHSATHFFTTMIITGTQLVYQFTPAGDPASLSSRWLAIICFGLTGSWCLTHQRAKVWRIRKAKFYMDHWGAHIENTAF